MDNTLAHTVWTNLAALCLPVEELRNKHGITWIHPHNAKEIRLGVDDCTLVVTLLDEGISAVIKNESGSFTLPPERTFAVEGTADCPFLVESGSSTSKRISEVFKDLVNWLRVLAKHTHN